MSTQLLAEKLFAKFSEEELLALLGEDTPAPVIIEEVKLPQRNQSMRDYALELGIEAAADPTIGDKAVEAHLRVALAQRGLTLAEEPAKPAAKKGSAASRNHRRPNKAQKADEQVARRGYAWAKPTTPRTAGLSTGSPVWNYYIQGDWTWVRTTKSPTVDQLTALKSAGFAWSTRRAAFFAEKVVTLDKVHKLLTGR